MKIISELTGQEYKTVQECEEAETAYLEEVEAKKIAEEKLKEERKARAAAQKAAKAAEKEQQRKAAEDALVAEATEKIQTLKNEKE